MRATKTQYPCKTLATPYLLSCTNLNSYLSEYFKSNKFEVIRVCDKQFQFLKLVDKKVSKITDSLKPQLVRESSKCRDPSYSSVLSKELQATARELKYDDDIIIRRADKTNSFVILNRSECKAKLDVSLYDDRKFKKITRNSVTTLKTDVNRLIKSAKSQSNCTVLNPSFGEFKPG